MATGLVNTTLLKKVLLNRCFKASPDYTVPSYFDVGTGTTTPTIGDTNLATPLSLNKSFVSGYPLLDEATLQATVRGIVLTTEANGNSLTEFGIKNTDGTPKLVTRLVHTGISKTSSVQVVYVWKVKIS